MLNNKIISYLVWIYILMLPLLPNGLKLGKIPVSGDVILAIIIISYIMAMVFLKKTRENFIRGLKDFFYSPISVSMIVLFIVMMISITYAADKKIAFSESSRFITYIILFFIIKYECFEEYAIEGMIKAYVSTSVILSLAGLVQYFTGYGSQAKFENFSYAKVKINVTLDNPNNLAAFMVLAFFPTLMLFLQEKNKRKKGILGCCSALILISIFLTFSRNALIGILIGSVTLVLLHSVKMVFPLIGVGAVSLFIPQITQRLSALFDPVQNQSRLYLWHIAVKMIKDHPILGVGNGNYVSRYDEYVAKYPEYAFYGYTKYPCHNSYLKVFSELGIIGIVSFLSVIIIVLVRMKKIISSTNEIKYKYYFQGILASFVAFLFMNLADNLFFVPKTTTYFWILFAICESYYYNYKKSNFKK